MTNTTTTTGQLMFSVTDCSRCGGTGTYSWCQRFGDTCFKCQGKGLQLTREAAKAQQLAQEYREARTVPVAELAEGDTFYPNRRAKIARVASVHHTNGTVHVDLVAKRQGCDSFAYQPDMRVRRGLTDAERAELDQLLDAHPGTFRA